jgi:predicted metal-binding protein
MSVPAAKSQALGRVSLAKAPAAHTIFVCAKCAKKLPGHPGAKAVRAVLKDALKRLGPTRGWGKVRIVQAGCFDLCPKRRQVLASGETLAHGRLVVVDADLQADAALGALLNARSPPGSAPRRASSNPAEDRAEDGVERTRD